MPCLTRCEYVELVPVVHRTCAITDEFVLESTLEVLAVMQDYVWAYVAVSMVFTFCLGPRIENFNIVSFFSCPMQNEREMSLV